MHVELGIGFSSEELGPNEIVRAAALAEEVGFTTAWVSDHYHPWIDAQGESPFVWSVLGGIASTTERSAGGYRRHVSHDAHPSGDRRPGDCDCAVHVRRSLLVRRRERRGAERAHPRAEVAGGTIRLAMLEEAVAVIRALWKGEQYSHYGDYYTVENARLYTTPSAPPPIIVSAFGPKSVELAARIGDGMVSTAPDRDLLDEFDAAGGAASRSWLRSRSAGRRPNVKLPTSPSNAGRPRA